MFVEFAEVFEVIYPRIRDQSEGARVVVARTQDGNELSANWWHAAEVPSAKARSSMHVQLDLPEIHRQARHHVWLARGDDDGIVVGGTGGMSPGWLSIPRVTFRRETDGITLDVSYDRQEPTRYRFYWV